MAGRKELVRFGAAWLAFKRNNLPWRWIGFSEGGLQVTYNTETTDHFVDQSTSPIKTQITSETLEAVFPAVESTLENFALAFPGSYLRDGTLHIRPASEASTAQSSGIVLIHPVYRGAPVGDIFDPTNTAYDGTDDFMFYASLVSSLDITYGREDMIHIPLTFRGSPDPAGQLGVMGNPLNNNPFEFDHLSLVTTVGTPVSETLAATGSGVVAP